MSSIEATIICIDNSDYNRNEDIVPNRFLSQIDCVNVLCCNKTSMHYKNNIGILMMAGDKTKVKVSLTNDIGQLLSCIHDIKLDGTCDIVRSLLIAQLALKHRVDKNLGQKIMLFVGSPFKVNEKQLISTGKQLKKNNICLDIISYGDINRNRDILMLLYNSVNSNDNCRFIECPETENNLSRFVLNSLLNNNDYNLGNMQEDDQLMSAMQMSLEESQQVTDHKNTSTSPGIVFCNNSSDLPTIEEIENMKDIDNELKEALILSLKEYNEKNKMENANQEGDVEVEVDMEAEEEENNPPPPNESNPSGTSQPSDDTPFDEKEEENFPLVNESYKNNFDSENHQIQKEESKEKKENESYEKVFKMDKEEGNLQDNNTQGGGINENLYNSEKGVSKENEGVAVSNEDPTNGDAPTATQIQDTSYISTILGKINATVNVFSGDKSDAKAKESENQSDAASDSASGEHQ
ncbi:26S proteasome non-ATPase regulatory subunit 4 [Plasmodium coatneyi]|uniref:26S proteasome non-ATPase regulatory subunit 4 n=1 Tax=Plasmodium coatneyi TaxID=208452 RepID=A0A1B1DSR4_9APIC|nr:26S proteasome non-ATPase regulatory subunit 4 [Plasmodium coatneyi]ANQ05831.1 26S proteasome non-ATPase regulatory subunit 4 [Plasmodium coatneyi]